MFSRTSGIALQIPPALWENWLESMTKKHREAQGAGGELSFREFLARSIVDAAMEAVRIESASKRSAGDPVMIYRATFEFDGDGEEPGTLIAEADDFVLREEEGDEGKETAGFIYDWAPPSETSDAEASSETEENPIPNPIIRLKDNALHIDAFTTEERMAARERLEGLCGERIRFKEEREIDMLEVLEQMQQQRELVGAAQQDVFGSADGKSSAGSAGVDDSKTQPSEAGPDEATRVRQHFEGIRDRVAPVLDGKTPAEAAREPAMRPKLIRFMKVHLHALATQNRNAGAAYNVDWLLDELGLGELK